MFDVIPKDIYELEMNDYLKQLHTLVDELIVLRKRDVIFQKVLKEAGMTVDLDDEGIRWIHAKK